MDTFTVIQESQPTKKVDISLRQLIDIDETGGVKAETLVEEGNITHNQILTAYAEAINIAGDLGKVKVFRFKNLVSLMSGGTGISVSTNPSNITTITNTGVTSIIAGTGITVSGATGDVTIDSTSGGDMYTSTYDTDLDGVVDQAECVKIIVRNSTGATLTKGQVVYLSGATGNRPNAVLADATTEATSSKTIGLVSADILNNADGYVTISGTMHDLDLSMFAAGDRLWLNNVPGGMAATTPPAEPNHAVFIGTVARAHPTQGRIVLAIQNGYELDELHGVSVPSPSDNDVVVYESATSLWKNKSLATILGYTPFNLPSLTSGSVLFSNGTTIAQDNTNFFWDNTNKRLGIGTSSPQVKLEVFGTNELLRFGDGTSGNDAFMSFNSRGFVGFKGTGGLNFISVTTRPIIFGVGTNFSTFTESARFAASTGNFLIGTTTDVASAILQASSTTKGFLPPRMTTAQRTAIASPAAGLMVYDTTLNALYTYNGTSWVASTAGASSATYVFNMNSFAVPNNSLFYGVYLGGTPVTPPVVATQYGGTATDFFPGYPMPAGVASTLVVILRAAQVAPTSTVTLKLANTNTSTFGPVVTIAAGSAAGTYTDNSATVSFAANERLNIIASNPFVSGATASGTLTTGSFKYTT